jgi:hypothetical protein
MVLLTDLESRVDPDVWGTPGSAYGDHAKIRRFRPFWPVFHGITHRVGSRVDPDVWGTPGSAYGYLAKTRRFGPFWPLFYGITH